jgi:hypothetical protein
MLHRNRTYKAALELHQRWVRGEIRYSQYLDGLSRLGYA